mgnify:FL=1
MLALLYINLKRIPYENKIWSNKYPQLIYILKNGNPGIPNNNVIRNNLLYQTTISLISKSVIKYGNINNNNLYKVNPGFVNSAKMDFRLRKSSIIYKQIEDLKIIPFKNIGSKH